MKLNQEELYLISMLSDMALRGSGLKAMEVVSKLNSLIEEDNGKNAEDNPES